MLEDKIEMLLDMCTIRAEPVLDFYVEHLELPKEDIKQLNMKLEGIETAAGLVILSKWSFYSSSLFLDHLEPKAQGELF